MGLAVGPMSDFDAVRLNAEFFTYSTWAVNFLVNLDYADDSGLRTRQSRPKFEECVQIL